MMGGETEGQCTPGDVVQNHRAARVRGKTVIF